MKKLNTLPQPYIDLDLTFVSYLPFEDKLSHLLNINKNIPLRTFKVYRCRLVDDICFILATGTPLGTHLVYLYTTGNHQVIDSIASIEDNMKLSDEDLMDILENKP